MALATMARKVSTTGIAVAVANVAGVASTTPVLATAVEVVEEVAGAVAEIAVATTTDVTNRYPTNTVFCQSPLHLLLCNAEINLYYEKKRKEIRFVIYYTCCV